MKIYKSKTILSISVKLPNGKGKHLMFDAMSDGTSSLRVTNKDIMKAIESHPKYGKQIILYKNTEEEEEQPTDTDTAETPETASIQTETAKINTQVASMNFDNFEDAREYVHETFGISLLKLKTVDRVIEAAKEKGIHLTIGE